jgi:hypothetical protein
MIEFLGRRGPRPDGAGSCRPRAALYRSFGLRNHREIERRARGPASPLVVRRTTGDRVARKMRRLPRVAVTCALVIAVAPTTACSFVLDFDGLQGGPSDASATDAPPASDAAADAPKRDASDASTGG